MAIKRTTVIVGAGAVLDFDFSYEGAIIPSTTEITKRIKEIKVSGLDVPESDIINAVYSWVNGTLNSACEKQEIKTHHHEINFEELYFSLEILLTQNNEYASPSAIPMINTLEEIVPKLKKYPKIEIIRGLEAIIYHISKIVDNYDCHFNNHKESELWYRDFWQNDNWHKWDVFTFNYDTTIENSISEYEDGFIQMSADECFESFVPSKLINNKRGLSTIQHLHGCIYYAESAPWTRRFTHGNRDMFKYHSVQECQKFIGLQWHEKNQALEEYINAPILIGLHKLDKMTFLPHSIYHANLVNKLQDNSGLLIIGYSFGDLYVNQLLQKRILMHGNNHRMIIIESFPQYVDSIIDFYGYLTHHRPKLRGFLQPFIDFSFDEHFKLQGVEFTSHSEPIYSLDHNCMILICGFKQSIVIHKELILSFLEGK